MRNIPIKSKFYALAAMVSMCLILLPAVALNSFSNIKLLNEVLLQVQSSEALMLMLRRNEKDFMARLDPKYQQKFKNNFNFLTSSINSISKKSSSLKLDQNINLTRLIKYLESYKTSFGVIVSHSKKMGLTPNLGQRGELRRSIHNAEALLKKSNSIQLTVDMLMLRRNEKDFMLRRLDKYLVKFENNYTVFNQHLRASGLNENLKNDISLKTSIYHTLFKEYSQLSKQLGLTPNEGLQGEMRSEVHKTEQIFDTLHNGILSKITSLSSSIYWTLFLVAGALIAFIVGAILFIAHSINTRLIEQHKRVIETSIDAFIIINQNGIIQNVNGATSDLFGYTEPELIGEQIGLLMTGEHANHHDRYLDEYVLTGKASIINSVRELKTKHKNGSIIEIHLSLTDLTIDSGEPLFSVIIRDITKEKHQREQLENLAHYDLLTGVPNRLLFTDRFNQAVAHSKRSNTSLAMCFLDIDYFKSVNDKFGHDVGDNLLIEVSKRMIASLREADTVSRQGGDEFTLLLGDIDNYKECEHLISRLLAFIAEPYVINGKTINITASCGVTLFPLDDANVDTLVRHADQAMYLAKKDGRNAFAFFDAMTEKSSQKHMLFLKRVSQAIIDNELMLYYQPKVNMLTGEMFGAEALIRWQHPDDGLIVPYGFLPKIENTQVMLDVGHWVIESALQQLIQWCKEGRRWVISINIDAYHFMQEGFFEELQNTLEKHPDLPKELLEIEILETVAFTELESVASLIQKCQLLGVSFALDDFGTGYSSLAYLKGLPVQWLKVDQTFVRDMLVNEQDLALIEGIVSLAKAFKRKVIAEGVETIEHGSELIKLGCYNAQGYGIAKPMPAEDLVRWEESYQANKSWTRQ